DFTDLHAWCEVYIPGAGWVGLDPTSGLFASEGHIPLACTPEPSTAAPISGATEKCKVEFAYSNEVTRIYEDPRVTKPYTEYQWSCADALGKMVDQQFETADLRLTMGGEPTFISVDDMESAQWNTDALGAHKLKLAKDLLIRLRDRFAPHALLHYGQGKWYPGEEVPRWALGCFWRKDSTPLWRNPQLLARIDKDYGFTLAEADTFSHALAAKINVASKYINRAYENALFYLWQEENLPVGVDPYHASMKDGLERKQLARVLHQGIDQPSGFVLPLGWDFAANKWYSTTWNLKAERVVLIPGDSPMGLRLPLDALPLSGEREIIIERDPFEERDPLPTNAAVSNASAQANRNSDESNTATATRPAASSQKKKSATIKKINVPVLRTSLCIQPREGKIFVFMPPLEYLEHYVDLIEKIEQVATDLTLPVIIEGYEPPRDSRIQKLLITPDPGVIEVNVHPAGSWQELSDITTALYEEARLSRLATEKFMLDGRHTGTGGGNHVTLGGPTPADSPLLRRPDLIRSLVTYWQHHPSLSYLFSGMFIGPTSQAPRVDEGREEMLYELEVAFEQIPEGDVAQPWLVDRLLRNLLIDVTGNTHRAEFCIDKLYSPSGASGRQGILEFRGFEMPPHPRMALVQVLLLRCLVARFWNKPYQGRLIRWGTRLHDQFMLPHFIWSDIREVVRDLNNEGYPFQLEWLVPFEEFRFPYYGRLEVDDIHLELRWAIEPWHVLGEEVSSFGTARYVDSSIERLQVKVSGITPGRHILSCNGRRVPLRSTGKHGEFVAGVRYRAWQPPSALHPTIGVHAPLVFDIIDSWNGRAIGGCTYHVSHAGGRSYDVFPVNALEAESRRINRFWSHGHTPGGLSPPSNLHLVREFFPNQYIPRPMAPPLEEASDEYPLTLDLRKQ
ncbi:MAG: transglutaminase family protein, partial [Pseudomonadales bacterium]